MGTEDGEFAQVIPLQSLCDQTLFGVPRKALASRVAANEDPTLGGIIPKVWRATARRAARDLGRPVPMGQVGHEDYVVTVGARLTDWLRTPDEVAAMEACKRRIAEAMAEAFPLLPGKCRS